MAQNPESSPSDPQNTPFVALNPDVTKSDLPQKKAVPLPKTFASLLPENGAPASVEPPAAVNPAPKPVVGFFNEKKFISIAPEFAPPPDAPPPKTEMDFSLDYKNPETDPNLSKPPQDLTCYRCARSMRTVALFSSDKGPVCPKCFNPYRHRLFSNIFHHQEEASGFFRALVAALHFIAAWLIPVIPAIIWYGIFVNTGFGTVFEDCAVVAAAPTVGTLVFLVLSLAGVFLIPASLASLSLGTAVTASLAQINPAVLFQLIRAAMPGYLAVSCVLAGTAAVNLAVFAQFSETGGAWTGSILVLPLSLCMAAVEMVLIRSYLGRTPATVPGTRDDGAPRPGKKDLFQVFKKRTAAPR